MPPCDFVLTPKASFLRSHLTPLRTHVPPAEVGGGKEGCMHASGIEGEKKGACRCAVIGQVPTSQLVPVSSAYKRRAKKASGHQKNQARSTCKYRQGIALFGFFGSLFCSVYFKWNLPSPSLGCK